MPLEKRHCRADAGASHCEAPRYAAAAFLPRSVSILGQGRATALLLTVPRLHCSSSSGRRAGGVTSGRHQSRGMSPPAQQQQLQQQATPTQWHPPPHTHTHLRGEAGLRVELVRLQRRWVLPKHHLAGEVLEVGLHVQRQPKGVGEELQGRQYGSTAGVGSALGVEVVE